jgi:AraC family L-rhamnose operon transcriptional activator RhaR
MSAMAYLAHHRMETAAVLLGRTDQNYFARRFKAHYGLSPTTYRLRGVNRPGTAADESG